MTTNDKTVLEGDKTVVQSEDDKRNDPNSDLIFGWLIEENSERVYRINRERINIGSDPSCDIVLKESDVDKLHCFLYFEDGRFEINDNNTHGRTKLNGKPVRREFIDDGAQLSIGTKNFILRCFRSRI